MMRAAPQTNTTSHSTPGSGPAIARAAATLAARPAIRVMTPEGEQGRARPEQCAPGSGNGCHGLTGRGATRQHDNAGDGRRPQNDGQEASDRAVDALHPADQGSAIRRRMAADDQPIPGEPGQQDRGHDERHRSCGRRLKNRQQCRPRETHFAAGHQAGFGPGLHRGDGPAGFPPGPHRGLQRIIPQADAQIGGRRLADPNDQGRGDQEAERVDFGVEVLPQARFAAGHAREKSIRDIEGGGRDVKCRRRPGDPAREASAGKCRLEDKPGQYGDQAAPQQGHPVGGSQRRPQPWLLRGMVELKRPAPASPSIHHDGGGLQTPLQRGGKPPVFEQQPERAADERHTPGPCQAPLAAQLQPDCQWGSRTLHGRSSGIVPARGRAGSVERRFRWV